MPTLNLDPDFPDHPKTARLRGRIGPTAEAVLLRLWCYACKHHPDDGEFRGYTAAEMESIGGWIGDAGVCLDACVAVGFVDVLDGGAGFALHNWRDRQGHLPVYRARARANAEKRWAKVRAKTAEIEASTPRPALPEPPTPEAPVEQKPALRGVKPSGSNATGIATSIARSNAIAGHGIAGHGIKPPIPQGGVEDKAEKRKRAKAAGDGLCADAIPERYRTPRVLTAWSEYCDVQREKGHRMTPTRAVAQWRQLSAFSEPEAHHLIGRAAAPGWQGIVFDKDVPGKVMGPNRMPPSAPPAERDAANRSAADAADAARRSEAMRAAKGRADVFAAVAALDPSDRERRRLSAVDAAQTVQRSVWSKADPMLTPGLASAMLSVYPKIDPQPRNQ